MPLCRLLLGRSPARGTLGLVTGACIAWALTCAPAYGASPPFGMAQVVDDARNLAAKPYRAPPTTPSRFTKLDFDQWQAIRYRRQRALWHAHGDFHVQFAPAGYLYPYKIVMNVMDDAGVHRVKSSPQLFDYNEKTVGTRLTQAIGFSGLRLLYPINKPTKYDEILSFLGASYFRGVARGNVFGLSARGLAVDTAGPGDEEFPLFREFWLQRPAAGAGRMTVYALLDSPSISGAYRFVVKPGAQTVMDVKAVLFARKKIAKLGLAPLTSMYLYGVGNHKPPGYLFPAAHDSDGLLIHAASGRWIWRPLSNPRGILDNTFSVERIKGFGLMQRDRDPRHYADDGLGYARRPSAWITPLAGWPKGRVELVELHSPDENNDNIAAFWNPTEPVTPGKTLRLSYRIHWQGTQPHRSRLGRVVATRIGRGAKGGSKKFVIDFAGGPLRGLAPDAEVKSALDAGGAKVVEDRVLHNPHTGGWRLVFQVIPQGRGPNVVRVHLTHRGKPLTETWDYPVTART